VTIKGQSGLIINCSLLRFYHVTTPGQGQKYTRYSKGIILTN